ncbi:MAG: phosphatase PAP2 family protein [Planctomycetota bacterium]
MSNVRAALVVLAGFAACIATFQLVPIDLWLQDRLFDPSTSEWFVDEHAWIGLVLCYHGPKVVAWIVGLTAITLALGPARWRDRFGFRRRGLWLVVLALGLVPALVGLGKRVTNVHCPRDLSRYGGKQPHAELCSCYSPQVPPTRAGKCWPAGHASGGFALLGLSALRSSRRWKRSCWVIGMTLGWWMGGYQMLRGAHFLSHTVATMWVAAAVVIALHALLDPRDRDADVRVAEAPLDAARTR